jgi:hypothetical protein
MPHLRLAAAFIAAAFVALMLAPVVPANPGGNLLAPTPLTVASR